MSFRRPTSGVSVGQGARAFEHVRFDFSEPTANAIEREIAKTGGSSVGCSYHVVAYVIEQLRSRVENYRYWQAAYRDGQTNAQARDALLSLASQDDAKPGLQGMDMRARAFYRDALLQPPVANATPQTVAKAAAGAIPVKRGRTYPPLVHARLVEYVEAIVQRVGLRLSQGGPFLRVCAAVFEAAGIPDKARDGVRSLQAERKKLPT